MFNEYTGTRNSPIADKPRLQVSQGHQTWYHSMCQVWFPICPTHRQTDFWYSKNAMTLKTGLRVHEGHRKCRHSTESLWLPIDVL